MKNNKIIFFFMYGLLLGVTLLETRLHAMHTMHRKNDKMTVLNSFNDAIAYLDVNDLQEVLSQNIIPERTIQAATAGLEKKLGYVRIALTHPEHTYSKENPTLPTEEKLLAKKKTIKTMLAMLKSYKPMGKVAFEDTLYQLGPQDGDELKPQKKAHRLQSLVQPALPLKEFSPERFPNEFSPDSDYRSREEVSDASPQRFTAVAPLVRATAKEENPLVAIFQALERRDENAALFYLRGLKRAIDQGLGLSINTKLGGDVGLSLLHQAVIFGAQAVVEALLALPGIIVDIQDFRDRTPLHYAAYNIHNEHGNTILLRLLDAGANPQAKNRDDHRTPADMVAGGYCKIRETIKDPKELNKQDLLMTKKRDTAVRLLQQHTRR